MLGYLGHVRDRRQARKQAIAVPAWRWRLAQSVERGWWRRYLDKRDPGDYRAWKRAYWQEFLARVGVEVPAGARVLDAGCGPAGVFSALPQAVVVAVDPLLGGYRDLPHFVEADWPHVRFVEATLEGYVPERRFDIVFSLNVINHVRDLTRSLATLRAALACDGVAVISVDVHRHRLARAVFAALPGDVLHPHQYTQATYESAIESSGLRIAERHLLKREALFDYVAFVCVHGGELQSSPAEFPELARAGNAANVVH